MKRLIALLFCWSTMAATWYVSPYGTNSNLGTGPAPNQAWCTITCALVTSNAWISPGDTIYIAPGTYREAVTLDKSYSGDPLYVRGDPRNEIGFTDTSGNRLSPAYVRWTSQESDKALTSSSVLTISSYTNYWFSDVWFDSGKADASTVTATATAGPWGFRFVRCIFHGRGSSPISFSPGTDKPLGLFMTNCMIIAPSAISGLYIDPQAAPTSGELDLQVSIDNCFIMANNYGICVMDKADTYAFVGVNVYNSTLIATYAYSYQCTASTTPTAKNVIKGCILTGYSYGLQGSTCQAFDNTYNVYPAAERTGSGVLPGTGEQVNYSWVPEIGQSSLWFSRHLPWFSPTTGSPMLAFREDITPGELGTDLLGRIRPSGSGVTWSASWHAAGAMECHDFGVQETGVVSDGTYSLKLYGPGDHIIRVPVNASATTLTVDIRKDSAYSGDQPAIRRIAQPDLISGDTGETKTMSVSADTWQTLTFTSFTPTRKGVVYLMVESYDQAGNGGVYVDKITRNY